MSRRRGYAVRHFSSTRGTRPVADRLYQIRNSLAHGKQAIRTSDFGPTVVEVAAALSIVKLLARLAVDA
jgi:hypothetical protein